VLKGAGTLVCQSGKATALSPYAAPALATAGSGDVLAGCIAAQIAKDSVRTKNQTATSSFEAACLGVFAHAHAGYTLGSKNQRGFFAREIADSLPKTFAALCSKTPLPPLLPKDIYL
jgi:Predicted sugar kinase